MVPASCFIGPNVVIESGARLGERVRIVANGYVGAGAQIGDDTLIYATGRRGYKSGGFNLNTPEHSIFSSFQPEFVTDVEIGLKADWTIFGAKARTDIRTLLRPPQLR